MSSSALKTGTIQARYGTNEFARRRQPCSWPSNSLGRQYRQRSGLEVGMYCRGTSGLLLEVECGSWLAAASFPKTCQQHAFAQQSTTKSTPAVHSFDRRQSEAMADEERAAKAARAKALLKSHQAKKKKAATPASTPGPSGLSQLVGSAEDVTTSTHGDGLPSAASLFSGPASEAGGSDWNSVIGGRASPKLGPSQLDTSVSTLGSRMRPAAHPMSRKDSSASLKSSTSHSGYPQPSSRPAAASPLGPASPALPPQGAHHETLAPSRPIPTLSSRPPTPAIATPPVQHDNSAALAQLQATIQDQHQTINLLVSEKATLISNLEHLEGIEHRSQQTESLLEERTERVRLLSLKVEELEHDLQESSSQLSDLTVKEREVSERARNTQRELDLTKHSVSELKAEATEHRQRLRELEEQIQSDDRVEILEKSLKGVQDRAESLEFQLGKIKQAHAKTKAERDTFEQDVSKRAQAEEAWKQKHASLESDYTTLQSKLQALTSDRDSLAEAKTSLEQQLATSEGALIGLKVQVSQLSTDHGNSTRQLSAAQSELASAKRRIDQVEESHRSLQSENVELMSSLNEMRSKTVELNADKIELGERIEGLEAEMRRRDGVVEELEGSLEQTAARCDELSEELGHVTGGLGKEREEWDRVNAEREQAFSELEARARESEAVVDELVAERNANHAALSDLQAELEQALGDVTRGTAQLDALRAAAVESENIVASLDAEIKAIRMEGVTKDEEIHRLREDLDSASLGTPEPHTSSLNDELLNSLKQQHELDRSEAESRVRALETDVFQEQAKTHTLQRRVQALEDELRKAKAQQQQEQRPGHTRTLTPPIGPVSGRTSAEYRRLALGASPIAPRKPLESDLPHRKPVSLTLDAVLSPEARHKRKVSLSMLKARIESEMGGATLGKKAANGVHKPSPLGAMPEENGRHSPALHHPRPQFGDESHIFCCASCAGDLVVL